METQGRCPHGCATQWLPKTIYEIVIDKIGLCVQFHNVPIYLMTEAFALVLARRISRDVVKVIDPVDDFLRVCLMFPQGDAQHNYV